MLRARIRRATGRWGSAAPGGDRRASGVDRVRSGRFGSFGPGRPTCRDQQFSFASMALQKWLARVCCRLFAGGEWIRTCMGLFLSSGVFGLLRFFVRSGKGVLHPVAAVRFAERAEGVKGPKQ
jgi:hypothetical protein